MSQQRFDRSSQNWCKMSLLTTQTVKKFQKSRMADVRHFENRLTAKSPQPFDRFWWNSDWWRKLAFYGGMAVKISLSQQDIRKLLYVLFYDILRCFVHCVLGTDSLPYVEATILELLRYKTLGPMALPHRTMKDTELDGYFIPAGATVRMSVWLGTSQLQRYQTPFYSLLASELFTDLPRPRWGWPAVEFP